MKKISFLISTLVLALVIFGLAKNCWAATYYVNAAGGNDSRTAAQAQVISTPWATINKCNTAMSAGDTCMVMAGTYNEQITISHSGASNSAYTVFSAYQGQTVYMKGFVLNNLNYVKIVGFDISSSTGHGIWLQGSCAYIEILNNYIHNTAGDAIRTYTASSAHHHITIRGNTAYYLGCPVPGSNCAESGDFVGNAAACHHYLIEYNTVHRAGDWLNLGGEYMVVRNNYFYDYADSEYTANSGMHVDFTQPGSDGMNADTKYHVYEGNLWGDNIEGNSHAFQMRDSIGAGDHDILIRGNVIYNVGSYIMQDGAIDKVRVYNNTAYGAVGGGWAFQAEGSDGATGGSAFNNIVSDNGSQWPFYTDTASGATIDHNICYLTAAYTGCTNSNPLYVSASAKDFHLQAASPAKNTGRAITTVNQTSGSGTTVTLADGGMFIDGYGLTSGDIIKIGSNSPVMITSISGNNVTVNSTVTWNNGDGVYWRNQDASQDIGAYEYKPGGYTLTGTYTLSNGTLTVAPSDASLVRFVEIYENGVPIGTAYSSPFTVSGVGNGQLAVKMYSMFASSTPIVAATGSSQNVVYGDVSGDGTISAYDASLAAQYAVGLITLTPTQITAADVSGDGTVSAYDASLIAQKAVGLISKFPVEG